MPSLYNCKHSGDQYRISKFDSDFNLEASYLLDADNCECPAGHRPSCRHREMLPKFIQRKHIGDGWFYDHDRGGWVQGWKEEPAQGMTDDEASEMLKQPNEFADKILEERDRIERAMQEKYGRASEALPIQQTEEPSTSNQEIWLEQNEASMRAEIASSLAPAGLGQASEQTPSPLRFDKDHSNSIGHSPGYNALRPSPSPTIRRRV